VSFTSTAISTGSSSRRLEREAGRNVEVMWLTRRLSPDHKTMPISARTTVSPSASLHPFCRAAPHVGLLTQASVAIDAASSSVNNRTRTLRAPRWSGAWRRSRRASRAICSNSTARPAGAVRGVKIKAGRLKEKIEKLKEEMQRLDTLNTQMLTTPDSRFR